MSGELRIGPLNQSNTVASLDGTQISSEGAVEAFKLNELRAALGYERPMIFQKVSFTTVQDGIDSRKASRNEATLKFVIWGQDCHVVAEGRGPVDAYSNALKKGLLRVIPEVEGIHLDNYSVSLVNPSAETEATTRVVVTVHYKDCKFTTVDTSQNILIASALALNDAYELCINQILEDRESGN